MLKVLNFFERFLIFISAISECVLIAAFASLVGIPVSITSSAVGLKICVLTAKIYMKKKKHDKILLLAKTK